MSLNSSNGANKWPCSDQQFQPLDRVEGTIKQSSSLRHLLPFPRPPKETGCLEVSLFSILVYMPDLAIHPLTLSMGGFKLCLLTIVSLKKLPTTHEKQNIFNHKPLVKAMILRIYHLYVLFCSTQYIIRHHHFKFQNG